MGRRPKDWQEGNIPGFDVSGQPLTDTVEIEESGPEIPEDENPLDPAEQQAVAGDLRAQLLELLKDPEIATEAIRAALQTREGRQVLSGVVSRENKPTKGKYTRNYANEPALRVYGGLEVAHPQGYIPLPPSYIARYLTPTGNTTDHKEEAARDDQGEPIRTDMYNYWLDMRQRGEHMESAVKSDISAGVFRGGKDDGEFVPQRDDPGLPI